MLVFIGSFGRKTFKWEDEVRMSVYGWFYHLWFLCTKYVCIHQCLWEGGFGLLLNLKCCMFK